MIEHEQKDKTKTLVKFPDHAFIDYDQLSFVPSWSKAVVLPRANTQRRLVYSSAFVVCVFFHVNYYAKTHKAVFLRTDKLMVFSH